MKLSTFFTLAEAAHSPQAIRMEIKNEPPKSLYPSLVHVAQNLLDPIRVQVNQPVSAGSWYRSPEFERVLCNGAFNDWCQRRGLEANEMAWAEYLAKKQHPKGEAVDLEIPGIPNYQLALWIQKNLKFDQLILEFHKRGDASSGWVHVSLSLERNRNQVLTIGKGFAHQGLPNYGPLTHPKLIA